MAAAFAASASGASTMSSSWTVRMRRLSIFSSRRRRQTRTIASLMTSAAVPWIGVLRAIRSPLARML